MNSEKENNQITQYLLGGLPEDEAERFDELSFTDDDFAQKLKAAENDLVDRYIKQELAQAERQRFESYYLASPLRREKVKFAESLQIYAERNIEKTQGEKVRVFAFVNNLFGSNRMQFGFAAAALLLLIVGGIWIFTMRADQSEIGQQKTPMPTETPLRNESINPQNQIPSAIDENKNTSPSLPLENKNITPTPKPTITIPTPATAPAEVKSVIASIILSPPVRGGNKIQTLLITRKTNGVSIRLQLEADDYKTYSVSLLDPSGKSILQSGKLKAKSGINKFLTLNFPAKLLADGFYTLSASGVKADGTGEMIGDYPFRSVIK